MNVLEERKLHPTVRLFMEMHGDNAWLEAAFRADEAIAEGFLDKGNAWIGVAKAIQQLTMQYPRDRSPFLARARLERYGIHSDNGGDE